MNVELYKILMYKSKAYCYGINEYYLDFLHDIICAHPDLGEHNYKTLFFERKREIVFRKRMSYDFISYNEEEEEYEYDGDDDFIVNNKKNNFIPSYKCCRKCELIMQEHEFPIKWKPFPGATVGYYSNYCKKDKNAIEYAQRDKKMIVERERKNRKELKDGYIKDVLRKNGVKYITQEIIQQKREQLLKKRKINAKKKKIK